MALLARLVHGIEQGDEVVVLAKNRCEAVFPKGGHLQLWGGEGGARVTRAQLHTLSQPRCRLSRRGVCRLFFGKQ
jgi:hypothetical protein